MMGNTQLTTKKEENPDVRGTPPQNITVVLPAFNEEVSIGSIVLLTKPYCDNVIVVDDGSSDRTAVIKRNACRCGQVRCSYSGIPQNSLFFDLVIS